MNKAFNRSAFTLIEVLVVISILGLLVSLLLSAVQHVRVAAAKTACMNNLHQVALALQSYHDAQGSFPAGISYKNGKDPMLYASWCVRLLPYLDQQQLWSATVAAYQQQPLFTVNPPHIGLNTVMKVLSCPLDSRTLSAGSPGVMPFALTSYLGCEGINARRLDGILFVDSRVRLSDVTDGTSNTIIVGERPPSADLVLGWWYAGTGQSLDGSADLVLGVQEINAQEAQGSGCPSGPYGYGPGEFNNQCDAFHFWSPHPGGGNFVFADGSVHFLAYSAASALPALATRAGGETIPDY